MDDMAIHTARCPHETKEQHIQRHWEYVHWVLNKLEENNLYLKPKKCEFKKEEIKYLGVIVGKNHLKISLKKLQGVANWPIPKTPTNIWWFLGFTGYYCYFIPNYSAIARPLLDLTKKTTPWHWGEWQLKAFKELKSRMCSRLVLTQPNFDKCFILQVDVSAYGMGTILSQEGDPTPTLAWCQKPILHPIAYYSATFTATKWNYDIYEWELLAIMKALVHWRPYLGWTKFPFIICMDHANLQYWKSPRNLNWWTARWHADLQEYDFELEYNKDIVVLPHWICTTCITAAGQTIIPNIKELKRAIVSKAHDAPTAGHPGQDEMPCRVQEHYWWLGMKKWIKDYVKGCAICQQTKINTHKWHIPTYHISTTETLPFKMVAMDLITGLSTRRGFNATLMIVDHGCLRAVIFLPCNTTISGPGIAQLYLDNIYRWFGLPTKIISDRDPHFTSHFGKALTKKLGIQQNLSMAFHPQTNGLSEQKNQWVEQYLQTVTTTHPEDWSQWISIGSAVHNNQINATIRLLPNQILLGYHPILAPSEAIKMDNEAAEKWVECMIEAWDQAIKIINQKAGKPPLPQYSIGDQVWLEGTHLKLPHQTIKLAPKWYGPFQIVKQINLVTYQLSLPITWQIHPVFHASLLSPYHKTKAHRPNYSRPPPDLINGEDFFEVEQIQDHWHHGQLRTLQYLIKWKGNPESDNTWEPADLVLAPDLLKEYHKHWPLLGIKANQLTLQYSHHLPWPPQNWWASSILSSDLCLTPLTNSTNSICVLANTKTCPAPSHITANHISLTSTPSCTPTSAKNLTVAIIPEDHLLCQPRVCLAKDPLPSLHPLHPCLFRCALHPLNRTGTTSLATLALGTMIPFKLVRSPRALLKLLLPPSTPGASPSLPPLRRTSLQPPPIHPQTGSGPSLPDLLTPSKLEMMSIGRRSKDSKQTWQYYNRGWTKTTMALQNAHLGMRRTRSISPTSLSPSMTEQSDLPVSSNSSMMEGSQGSTQEQREKRKHELLSYMPLPITPLTNRLNPFPPGSVNAFGAIVPNMPSSRTLSMTLTSGAFSPMSTAIDSMTRTSATSSKRWSFWKQKAKVFARLMPSVRSTSSALNSPTRSTTSRSAPLVGPSSLCGRREQSPNQLMAPPTRDKDISM